MNQLKTSDIADALSHQANPVGHVLAYSAHEVIARLMGSTSVKLDGFSGQPATAPIWVPMVAKNAILTFRGAPEVKEKIRHIALVAAVFSAVALSGAAFLLGGAGASKGASSENTAIAWTVTAVLANSVSVAVAGQTIAVPVGSTLPNGEILRSSDPLKQTYATDSQVIVLRKR